MVDTINIRNKISAKGLKVTPQRMRVLEAIYELNNHPTADNIIAYIRKNDPNVGSGTVYKVLETLVENNLINKVRTEKDAMRFDGTLEKHHHIYCTECDHVEDFFSEELDEFLKEFFEKNQIDNFNIKDIEINITGNLITHKNKNK